MWVKVRAQAPGLDVSAQGPAGYRGIVKTILRRTFELSAPGSATNLLIRPRCCKEHADCRKGWLRVHKGFGGRARFCLAPEGLLYLAPGADVRARKGHYIEPWDQGGLVLKPRRGAGRHRRPGRGLAALHHQNLYAPDRRAALHIDGRMPYNSGSSPARRAGGAEPRGAIGQAAETIDTRCSCRIRIRKGHR